MPDATQLAVKATIIEDAAVSALLRHKADKLTTQGQIGRAHMIVALVWSVSVLTGEPMFEIRARIEATAKALEAVDPGRPTRAA